MRRCGVHTSIAGGLPLSLERANALGCNTLQIFSHNPRGWAVKEIPEEDASAFICRRRRLNISPVFIHASYLINLASRDVLLRKKSIEFLVTEMNRADIIGADYVVIHPGSAVGHDEGAARKRAIDSLSEVFGSGTWKAGLLIENTAGERGDISSRIADLAEIMTGVRGEPLSGICFDTCHAYAAGYDIGDEETIKTLMEEVERNLGPDKIKLIHLNDSKGALGSHVNRHEHIDLGKIGLKGLGSFINYERLKHVPLILETPKKHEADDPINLEKVRRMIRSKR